jgi:hypothetical protein
MIYHICIITMSVKGVVYVHEAYEAKKKCFFCYVNTSHRHRFYTYIYYSCTPRAQIKIKRKRAREREREREREIERSRQSVPPRASEREVVISVETLAQTHTYSRFQCANAYVSAYIFAVSTCIHRPPVSWGGIGDKRYWRCR